MSVREGLGFESELQSDCASLAGLVEALAPIGRNVHCLRDLTRGGLAAALNEIAIDASVGIEIQQAAIPISEPVAAACEVLGLDPLYVANEGRLVAFVAPSSAEKAWRFFFVIRRRTARRSSAMSARGIREAWKSAARWVAAACWTCFPASRCRGFAEPSKPHPETVPCQGETGSGRWSADGVEWRESRVIREEISNLRS